MALIAPLSRTTPVHQTSSPHDRSDMDSNHHPRHHTRRPPTPPRQSAAHAHRPPPNGHGYAASSDPHHAPYDASGFIDTDEDEETEHELVHPHPSHGNPPNGPAYNDDDDEEAEGEEEGEEQGGPEELEEEEEADELSDSSSADYDPHADPAEFAKRLDELAGVREVGVREERAVKGGPVLGLLPGEKRGELFVPDIPSLTSHRPHHDRQWPRGRARIS